MAQLLLISTKTKKPNTNIGDVVGVFPDDHKFTAKEQDIFTIVKVNDKSVEGVVPEIKQVYNDNGTWKVIDDMPRYKMRYNLQDKTLSHNFTGDALE